MAYRLDRPHELTQDFDYFKFPQLRNPGRCLLLTIQFLLDRRPQSPCPRWLAYVSTCLTLFYWPAFGVIDWPVCYSDVGYNQVSFYAAKSTHHQNKFNYLFGPTNQPFTD